MTRFQSDDLHLRCSNNIYYCIFLHVPFSKKVNLFIDETIFSYDVSIC